MYYVPKSVMQEQQMLTVSFKFIRVNYESKRAITWQNTLEITSMNELGNVLHTNTIHLSLADLLSPLKHVISSSVNRRADTKDSKPRFNNV